MSKQNNEPKPERTQREDQGYVNYFDILGLSEHAKPGDVRKAYKRKMKDLVSEIGQTNELTEERRSYYLLEMAKLNAALYILRDPGLRDSYWQERNALIELESQWRQAEESGSDEADTLRRQYDTRIRSFLARYMEELVLEAGRDKECVEASGWDEAHERHASRLLRNYRQSMYQQILERLPYFDLTPITFDWDERKTKVRTLLEKAPH